MHDFTCLIDGCVASTLHALESANEKTFDALQTSASTTLVRALQVINLQKAILLVGMFSLFEAQLQDALGCDKPFQVADRKLQEKGEVDLRKRLDTLRLAVNVLKHGRGISYDKLVAQAADLPFRVKLPQERFFFEGDISEVNTLVEVDDDLIRTCAEVIGSVCKAIG